MLVSLIVVKALSNTAISSMTGFDINGLKGTITNTLSGAQKAATTAANTAIKATTESAQSAVKTTGAAVAGALGGVFNNPFESDKR